MDARDQGVDSPITFHGPLIFLITVLGAFLQLKGVSPFETDGATMLALIVDLCVYTIALVAEITLRTHRYHPIVRYVSHTAGALASTLLLLILVPPFGWFIIFILCALLFGSALWVYHQQIFQLLHQAASDVLNILNSLVHRNSTEQ